jgi:hypothetical protein
VENRRYLCSQLATLTIGGQEQWVNIEEIWATGALLECETAVAADVEASLLAEGNSFSGRLSDVRQDDFGWRAEMAFVPETLWSLDRWRPEHLLDPAGLKPAGGPEDPPS